MRTKLLLSATSLVFVTAAGAGFVGAGSIMNTPASAEEVSPVAAAVIDAEPARTTTAKTNAEVAYDALSRKVARQSHPNALKVAFEAYFNYRDANPNQVRKPYLYYIDYGLSNTTPRGYVFNMNTLDIVEGPFTVAHGRGSGARNGVPTRFSNTSGSAMNSLGLYLTQETYNFSGTSGGRRYSSIGLRMKGLSGKHNSNARARGVVVHGAPYVTAGQAGRSEGCPAMEQARARRLLPDLARGSLVFVFAPNSSWMASDPWINA